MTAKQSRNVLDSSEKRSLKVSKYECIYEGCARAVRNLEWDDDKDAINRRKHGIGLGEAAAIFQGPVFTRIDPRETTELRETSLGMIGGVAVLPVVHTDREGVTRLIGARKATRRERRLYHGYLERTLG